MASKFEKNVLFLPNCDINTFYNMKKLLFYLSVLFCTGLLKAQTPVSSDLLLANYNDGIATLKDGKKVPGLYNYSIVTKKIQFLGENDIVRTFENPKDVSAVTIGERVFENTSDHGFLERVAAGGGFYYIEWGAKRISGGYLPECSYYLKNKDQFEGFDSPSSLAKAMECCKKELEDWAKKENIQFKNPDDVHRMMVSFLGKYASSAQTIYNFTVKTIDGNSFSFSSLKGKKLLIVNVASYCKFTPQYAQLQELYLRYKSRNLVVIGFPANNFGEKEPRNNEEIKDFCTLNYGVTFPMMAKISVKGADIDPLYRWLTTKKENGVADAEITWNFQKFLVDEQGRWVKSLAPEDSPLSEEIIAWIRK